MYFGALVGEYYLIESYLFSLNGIMSPFTIALFVVACT
jgi:hypothetical protein